MTGANEQEDLSTLRPGQMLHEYRVERILGQGGFGITYLARDVAIDRLVAVKEYFPSMCASRLSDATVRPKNGADKDFTWGLTRFVEEARLLARFQHPAIVRVLRYFEMFGTAYMVMDYVRGAVLMQILKEQDGPLPFDLIRARVLPVLDGLDMVHAAGVVHRDITPGNILIGDDGAPVLIDFGAARQLFNEHSRSVTALGTPGYAPLEQYCSSPEQQGPWSDVYAVSAVLYRCVAGRRPADAHDRIKNDPLPPAATVGAGRYPAAFLRAIDWGLAVDSDDRPRTIRLLRQALDGVPPSADPERPALGKRGRTFFSVPKPRRLVAAGAAAGLVAAALVGVWLLRSPAGESAAFATCDRRVGPLAGPGLAPAIAASEISDTVAACRAAVAADRGKGARPRLQLARALILAGEAGEAHKLLLGLADEADPAGQWALASEYLLGGVVAVDYAQALRWYRASAGQGFSPAQVMLGTMALRGMGMAADPVQARHHLEQAAAHDEPQAMQLLGALAQRDGDLVTAFRWYRRAAEHGSGEAVKALGEAYYRGQGVPRNPVLAFAYLRIAVNRMGVAVPSTILGRIAADLSPTQQAEAEDLVRGWTAGTRLPEESRSWTQ